MIPNYSHIIKYIFQVTLGSNWRIKLKKIYDNNNILKYNNNHKKYTTELIIFLSKPQLKNLILKLSHYQTLKLQI